MILFQKIKNKFCKKKRDTYKNTFSLQEKSMKDTAITLKCQTLFDSQKGEIFGLYKVGFSIRQISDQTNVPKSTVQRIILK